MNRFGRFLFCFSCIITVYSCLPDSDYKSENQEYTQTRKIVGGLEVIFNYPTGKIVEEKAIIASFSQPIVTPETEAQNNPFIISPPVDGHFKWLNNHTVAYYPLARFPFSTTITVRVPFKIQSLSGRALHKDTTWQFSTPSPEILSVFPKDGEVDVFKRQKIFIQFNQKILPQDVLAYTQIRTSKILEEETHLLKEDLIYFNVRYPHEDEMILFIGPKEWVVVLEPNADYPLDAEIEVFLSEKIKGAEGPNTMDESYSFKFRTHGAFYLKEPDCSFNCDPRGILKIPSSTPVKSDEFLNNISFNPSPLSQGHAFWDPETQSIHYEVDLKPLAQYELKISPNLKDQYDQELGKEYTYSLSTGSIRPQLEFKTGYQVFSDKEKESLNMRALNIPFVDLKVRKLNKDEILQFYYFDGSLSLNTDPFQDLKPEKEWTMTFPEKPNEFQSIILPLSEFIGENKSGALLIDVTTPLIYRLNVQTHQKELLHHKTLLQLTNLNVSINMDNPQCPLEVHEVRSGKPVGQASLILTNQLKEPLWKGNTDSLGCIRPSLLKGHSFIKIDRDKWGMENDGLLLFSQKLNDTSFIIVDSPHEEVGSLIKLDEEADAVDDIFEKTSEDSGHYNEESPNNDLVKEISLEVTFPLFGRVEDEFEGGVFITNKSTEEKDIVVTTDAEEILVQDEHDQTITLAPGETKDVWFKYRVEKGDEGIITVVAVSGEVRDLLDVTLPIIYPNETHTQIIQGETNEFKQEIISKPENIYPHRGELEITISSSPFILLDPEYRKLFYKPDEAEFEDALTFCPSRTIESVLRDQSLSLEDFLRTLSPNQKEAIRILREYCERDEINVPRFRAMIQRGNEALIETQFIGRQFRFETQILSLDEMLDKEELLIRKKGDGELFYRLELETTRRLDNDEERSGLVAIDRYIENLQGVDTHENIVAGSSYLFHRIFVFLEDVKFVVLEEPLPSGIEPIELKQKEIDEETDSIDSFRCKKTLNILDCVKDITQKKESFLFYADFVPKGVYELHYVVKGVHPGSYLIPPTRVVDTIDGKEYGESASDRVTIQGHP